MRTTIHALAGLALITILAGCHSNSDSAADQGSGKKYKIAVIPKGTSHSFWKSIHAGAVKAERELGNVEIIWKGPAHEDDRTEQINIVDNFVTRKVSAIVLAPLDREALVKPVTTAMSRGVPVVIVDSGLDSEDIVSTISTDNYNGGKIAAQHVGKVLGGKGSVVVLRYQVGSESTEQREKGFIETLRKEFPEIEVVSDDQYAGATQSLALTKAENILTRLGGKIDAWFCPCEPVTSATVQAVKSAGLAGKIKIVGFDTGADVVQALKEGEVSALVVQDPIQMGYLGVKTAVDKIEGKPIEKTVSTGEFLITTENMNDPRHQELLNPDLEKWLGE